MSGTCVGCPSPLSTPLPAWDFLTQHLLLCPRQLPPPLVSPPLEFSGAPSPCTPTHRILSNPLTLHPNSGSSATPTPYTPRDCQQPLCSVPRLLRTLPDPAPHTTPSLGPPTPPLLRPLPPGTPGSPFTCASDSDLPPTTLSFSSRARGWAWNLRKRAEHPFSRLPGLQKQDGRHAHPRKPPGPG